MTPQKIINGELLFFVVIKHSLPNNYITLSIWTTLEIGSLKFLNFLH